MRVAPVDDSISCKFKDGSDFAIGVMPAALPNQIKSDGAKELRACIASNELRHDVQRLVDARVICRAKWDSFAVGIRIGCWKTKRIILAFSERIVNQATNEKYTNAQ